MKEIVFDAFIEADNKKEVHDPEAVIAGLCQEIYAMGANDYERSEIESILNLFKNKKCTAAEAIQRVMEIRDSKHDYH